MLRTSHGAPRPAKGKAAPERPVRPAPRATRASAAEAKPAETRPRGPASRRASAATTEDEGSRLKDDGSRLKKAAPRVPGATSTASDDSREIAILIAVAGIEKKASGLEVIDVAGRVDYADFLVLMSGRSDRHVTALASAIEEALRQRNKRALAVEGLPHANWVLMDFGDVVVHVFQDDARSAYDIDALWMDARRVPVPLSEPLPAT
jgi:ribosome-associated protein